MEKPMKHEFRFLSFVNANDLSSDNKQIGNR